jgi:hypothetical protein
MCLQPYDGSVNLNPDNYRETAKHGHLYYDRKQKLIAKV